jgi:hypothetical protein
MAETGGVALSELDVIAKELVDLYRQVVRSAPADAAGAAAVSVGRALEAIQRAKRSIHPENAYQLAIADITDARAAVVRLKALPPPNTAP